MVFSISLESLYYTGLVLSLEMSEGSDICLEITKHKESFQSLTGSGVSANEFVNGIYRGIFTESFQWS